MTEDAGLLKYSSREIDARGRSRRRRRAAARNHPSNTVWRLRWTVGRRAIVVPENEQVTACSRRRDEKSSRIGATAAHLEIVVRRRACARTQRRATRWLRLESVAMCMEHLNWTPPLGDGRRWERVRDGYSRNSPFAVSCASNSTLRRASRQRVNCVYPNYPRDHD